MSAEGLPTEGAEGAGEGLPAASAGEGLPAAGAGEDPTGPRPPWRARFPGYHVLSQAGHWDETTRAVVLGRLGPRPALAFLTGAEERTARALCDRLVGLDGTIEAGLVEAIDRRLALRQFDGYRYEDMPSDEVAWRQSLAALDAEAERRCGRRFAELPRAVQREVLEAVRTHPGDWHGLPAARLWSLWMRYVCTAFYSHPVAWDEIGFGGPAYPRGYRNLGLDKREPWEVAEVDAEDPEPWARRVDRARRAAP